jgi:ribosomal-protein-alanine N-acetyltransferase
LQLVDPESPIRAGELVLEPIAAAHAAVLFTDLQARPLYTFIPHNPPGSVEALEERYTRWSKRQSPDGGELWLNYAVHRPRGAEYVGTVQATLQASGKAYIAYQVFPRYWRHGFGAEACTALTTHLFNGYDIRTVSALVDTRNEASWRLLESLGFHRAATIEKADEFKGYVSDEYLYELHRSEWRGTK